MTFNSQESSVNYDKLQESNKNKTKLDEYITELWKNWLTQNELNRISNRYLEEKDKLEENTRIDLKNLILVNLVTRIRSEIIKEFWYKDKILWNFYKNSAEWIIFEDLAWNKMNFFSKNIVSREEVLILNKFWIEMQNIIDWIKNPSWLIQVQTVVHSNDNQLKNLEQSKSSTLNPIQNPQQASQTPIQKNPSKDVKKTEWTQKINTNWEKTKSKDKKNTNWEKKLKKWEHSEKRELIKGETGIVSWSNVRIRNKDWKYSWNENVNKWDELILTWEKIKLPKWIYYGIEMEDGSVGYIHSRYIKLDKNPKIEKSEKDTSKEQLEKAKNSLSDAVKTAKEMLKDDKKDLEKIKAVDKKIAEKLKEIDKLLAGNANIEQINKASEELEKLIKERQELLKKMENSGKKVEEKIDKVQETTKWWGYGEKVEKWEKVVVAEYKVVWREDDVDMDTPGRKYDKEKWIFYRKSLYENDFELYKKDWKYILEMNWTWVFSDDKLTFDKIPTKDELKKKIDEMSVKYMEWDSRKYELNLKF